MHVWPRRVGRDLGAGGCPVSPVAAFSSQVPQAEARQAATAQATRYVNNPALNAGCLLAASHVQEEHPGEHSSTAGAVAGRRQQLGRPGSRLAARRWCLALEQVQHDGAALKHLEFAGVVVHWSSREGGRSRSTAV